MLLFRVFRDLKVGGVGKFFCGKKEDVVLIRVCEGGSWRSGS